MTFSQTNSTRTRQKAWIDRISSEYGHSYSRIAKESGLAQTTVSRFMDDEQSSNALSARTEEKIAQRYEVKEPPSAAHMANPKQSHLDGTAGMVSIPELGIKAAAGSGLVADELGEPVKQWMIPLIDLLGLSENPRALRIIAVEGDSMEPDYQPGEKILIDTSLQEYTHDGVYVLDFGFGLVVKHLQFVLESSPKKLLVVSTNPIYRPQEITLDKAVIKGKVAAKWQRR